MADVTYPLINGNAYSFASITIDVGGIKFRGFKEIKYEHSLEPGELRGNHPQLLARTRGQYKASGSLTVFQHEWEQLRDRMGNGFFETVFTVSVMYSELGPVGARCDTLHGVRFTKAAKGGSESNEGTEVPLDMHIMWIEESGKRPINNMLV
jgi:hypothetical protein